MAAPQPGTDEPVPDEPVPDEFDSEEPVQEEGPSLLADPGQRLLARIVDTLIVGLPVILVVRELVSGHKVDIVAPPAVAGCLLLYEAIQLAVWGRTLGKRFAGIEVVTTECTHPDVLRVILRAAVYSLPIAVRPVPVLGLLAGLFWVANAGLLYEGTSLQALHDRLAGTLVIKRPPSESPAP